MTASYFNKRLALFLLSTLLMRNDVASAYSNSPVRKSSLPATIADVAAVCNIPGHTTATATVEQTKNTKRVTYDLGIGKNRPVHNANSKPAFIVSRGVLERDYNMQDTTQYLTGYETAREFPSPSKPETSPPAAAAAAAPKKRTYPVLIPNRITDDSVLKIRQHSEQQAPQAVAQQSMTASSQFDLNTTWIEMLIHEQQQNLLRAQNNPNTAAATIN